MREKKLQLFVTFHTTASAMAMEKACKEQSLAGRLTPIPRQLSSDCGMAWRCEPALRAQLEALVREKQLEVQAFAEIFV